MFIVLMRLFHHHCNGHSSTDISKPSLNSFNFLILARKSAYYPLMNMRSLLVPCDSQKMLQKLFVPFGSKYGLHDQITTRCLDQGETKL